MSPFTASTFSATILILLTLFFQAPGEKWPCALTDIQVTQTQDTADAGHRTLIVNRTGTHTEQGQGTHDIGQADKRHIAKIPLMMIHCPVNSLMTLTPMTALFWRVGGSKTRAEEECEILQN